MRVAPNKGSKKINGYYSYLVTSTQSAKNDFKELSLLNKKTFFQRDSTSLDRE